MMDNLDFSEEEIQEQLAILGYRNIPKHRLREFKRDLDKLIRHEQSKSLDSSSELNSTKSQTAISQTSPPAYTKEKVNQYYITGPGNGFFLHAGKPDHGRQVLTSCQNRDYGTRQDYCDSYAQHSVASKFPRPSTSPTRLDVEPEPEDTQYLPYAVSQTSTPDRGAPGRPFIKRKVLRKHNGQLLVCDESVLSEESDASGLEERLGGLQMSTSAQQDPEMENEDVTSHSSRHSSETEGLSLTAFESYIRGMNPTRSDSEVRPKAKSFIRPALDHPHTRNLKKTDPVTRYFQYKQDWEVFKVPGERDRRALHWEIREQLAYQPPPPKPQRVYVPNTYVVPTEKKRSALRWEIRNDLANGLLPPRLNYRF
ncbi:centriolar and ciliogenesis-associated protein HYSL1 [Polymixia lowei]